MALGVVVALVVASGVALVVLRAGDDDPAPVATAPTTTAVSTTTTTVSTTTVATPTTVPATVPGTTPPTTVPEPAPGCTAGRPARPPGQMVVTVYFTCNGDTLVPAYRVVPTSRGVLRASLEALLAGPSSAERTAGVESWFSADTAGMLAGVSLSNGRAVVDFRDLRPVIPNASSSAGSQLLLSQLNRTVFQFSTVRSVEYRIDGSCARFFEWLQMACQVGTR